MPYFVYRISIDRKNLTLVDNFQKFAEAKSACRDMRKEQVSGDTDTIRLVHAKDQREAELLLRESNKPSSPVEEWEV